MLCKGKEPTKNNGLNLLAVFGAMKIRPLTTLPIVGKGTHADGLFQRVPASCFEATWDHRRGLQRMMLIESVQLVANDHHYGDDGDDHDGESYSSLGPVASCGGARVQLQLDWPPHEL